jgi:hypothetical protein
MFTGLKLNKRQKIILVVIVIFLVIVLIGVLCAGDSISGIFRIEKILYASDDYGYITSDSILFRTDRMIYDEDDLMIGALINLSPHTMEIGRDEPLIYKLTNFGWLPPMGVTWTMLVYPPAYEEDWILPGGVLSINMSFLWAKTPPKSPSWKMLEQQYFYNGNEYVVYSNEIVIIDESSQPSRFRVPPPGLINAPSIRTEIVETYVVALTNNSTKALWFNPLCSDVEVEADYPTDYFPYATLQRQSGEGTWEVLRPSKKQCTTLKEPVRIGPGETVQLFVGDGYPAPYELEPDVYRWHLVNYIDPFPECHVQSGCILGGAHLFTETFEP